MQTYIGLVAVLIAALIGFAGTRLVELLAPRLGLVQAPNERSSHIRPTPRGGGIAIAAAIVSMAVLLAATGAPGLWIVAALTLVIGLLGFSDDLLNLSPALRFPIQAIVLAALVWWSTPLAPIDMWGTLQLAGPPLAVLVVLVGLWWVNLFNFMDGIDGIAATHAIIVALGAALLWLIGDGAAWQDPVFALVLVTMAASSGFLLHNWPPARIFMGDAGSNSLALVIFAIALYTASSGAISYQAWLILPSIFVADATVTVLRRTLRGERPWHAHRRHAYQQLSRKWGHRAVTMLYSAISIAWAIPLAWAAEATSGLSWFLVLVCYAPQLAFVFWANAGSASEAAFATG